MTKNIENLKQLGLSEKEASVYLAALEYGPTTLARIAQKAGIKRTTIYEFLDSMLNKGILVMTVTGKRALYTGLPPENLEKLLEKQKEVIQDLIPSLSLLAQKGGSRPKIRFYEGIEGVKTIYNDCIDQPQGGSMVFASAFEDVHEVLPPSFMASFLKKKVERGIWARGIVPSGKYATERTRNNKKELRESIVIPEKEFPIRGETIVYQNKVAITSLGEEKASVIIESEQIADNQRAIINLLWKALKLLEKHKIKLE